MKKWLICFDWDGTLADSMDVCIVQIRLALERMGFEPRPEELLRACNGPAYDESVQILHIPDGMGEEFLKMRHAAELEILPEYQRIFPGVKEMLEALKEKAVLAIVSNGLINYLNLSMNLTGVSQYFDRLEPYLTGRSKTDALRQVMDDYPECTPVMIGDRLGDIVAGNNNGIKTIAASFGYGTPDEWETADVVVDSIEEMRAVLEKWMEE